MRVWAHGSSNYQNQTTKLLKKAKNYVHIRSIPEYKSRVFQSKKIKKQGNTSQWDNIEVSEKATWSPFFLAMKTSYHWSPIKLTRQLKTSCRRKGEEKMIARTETAGYKARGGEPSLSVLSSVICETAGWSYSIKISAEAN